MKTNSAKLWVKALRSGKYKQGYKQLKTVSTKGDRHCCLGVLCELAVQKKVISSYDPDDDFPPIQVCCWSDMSSFDGVLMPCGDPDESLAAYNDSGKYSFRKIATIIEKNIKDL